MLHEHCFVAKRRKNRTVFAINEENVHAFVTDMPHGVRLTIDDEPVVVLLHRYFEAVLLITGVQNLE